MVNSKQPSFTWRSVMLLIVLFCALLFWLVQIQLESRLDYLISQGASVFSAEQDNAYWLLTLVEFTSLAGVVLGSAVLLFWLLTRPFVQKGE